MLRVLCGHGGDWELIQELQRFQIDPKVFNEWNLDQQNEYLGQVLAEYQKIASLKDDEFVKSKSGLLQRHLKNYAKKPLGGALRKRKTNPRFYGRAENKTDREKSLLLKRSKSEPDIKRIFREKKKMKVSSLEGIQINYLILSTTEGFTTA